MLPQSDKIPIYHLAGAFQNVTTSYKYLHFKAILDSLNEGKEKISFNDLLLKAISNAWYSIHFYKLSLGKTDQMSNWVAQIDRLIQDKILIAEMTHSSLYRIFQKISFEELSNIFKEYSKYVPYRFLSPWFARELRGEIDAKKKPPHQNLWVTGGSGKRPSV